MVIRPIRGSTTPELQSLLSNPFGTELVICENRATSNGPTQQWQRWRYDNRTGFIFLLTGDPVEDHSETSNTLSEKKSLQQSLSSVSTSGVYQQPTVVLTVKLQVACPTMFHCIVYVVSHQSLLEWRKRDNSSNSNCK